MSVPFPVNIATFIMSGGPKKTIFIPQVVQMLNEQLELSINQAIRKETEVMIAQQEGEMEDAAVEEMQPRQFVQAGKRLCEAAVCDDPRANKGTRYTAYQ